MKFLKPAAEPVVAVHTKGPVEIPGNSYVCITDSGKLLVLTPEVFRSIYGTLQGAPTRKPFKRSDNATRKTITLEILAKAGKPLSASTLTSLLPPDCRPRVSANLVDLTKAGLVIRHDVISGPYLYTAAANAKS